MKPTPLIDTRFLDWLDNRDAVNVPQDKEEALEIISSDPDVISAYREENPEFVSTLSNRLLDSKLVAAVSRRFEFSTKIDPPTCFYHENNTHLFRLFPDWKIRHRHRVTVEECPLTENVPTIVSLFKEYIDHPYFSRSNGAAFRDAVIGVARGMGVKDICVFCGSAKTESSPLYAAHIVAKKWFKVIGFKERQSFDAFNGLMLCDGCHKAFDRRVISLTHTGSAICWVQDDITGMREIPEGYEREHLFAFIDTRNQYIISCNPLKTTEL